MNIEIKEQNGSYLGILTGWIDTADLLKLKKESAAKGGSLVLTHVGGEFQKILVMTGFIKLFNIRV